MKDSTVCRYIELRLHYVEDADAEWSATPGYTHTLFTGHTWSTFGTDEKNIMCCGQNTVKTQQLNAKQQV